jgi:hypothetical protein
VRRYQYTAIDDATRIRALKVYARRAEENAADSVNYVIKKFSDGGAGSNISTPGRDVGACAGKSAKCVIPRTRDTSRRGVDGAETL